MAASLTPFPSLWINEVQADNLTGITNRAGQHTGWLELYNPSTNVLSLNGLYLANNYTNLLQWAFPTQRHHQRRPVRGDLRRRPDQPFHHQ